MKNKNYPLIILLNIIVLISFFFNYFQLENSTFTYSIINLSEITGRFQSKGILTQTLILLLLYPYWFALLNVITTINKIKEIKFITKLKNSKLITNLIIKKLFFSFPLILNLYIYLGQYIIPLKTIWIHLLGILIFTLLIFSFYYYKKKIKKSKTYSEKLSYTTLYYKLMSMILTSMVIIILQYYKAKALVPIYVMLTSEIILFYLTNKSIKNNYNKKLNINKV